MARKNLKRRLKSLWAELRYTWVLIKFWQDPFLIKPKKLNHLRLKFLGYRFDLVARELFKKEVYEPHLTHYFEKLELKDAFVIDVGANLGYYSCLFSKLVGSKGSVIAIEPELNNLDLLKQNLTINHCENVQVFPVGLGEQSSIAQLNLCDSKNRGRHSLVQQNSVGSVDIAIEPLDKLIADWLDDQQQIALMKMDIEGYEPLAIKGAHQALVKTKVLCMEYTPELISQIQSPHDFLEEVSQYFQDIYLAQVQGLKLTNLKELKQINHQVDLIFTK